MTHFAASLAGHQSPPFTWSRFGSPGRAELELHHGIQKGWLIADILRSCGVEAGGPSQLYTFQLHLSTGTVSASYSGWWVETVALQGKTSI